MSLPLVDSTLDLDSDSTTDPASADRTADRDGEASPRTARTPKLAPQVEARAPTEADGALARIDYVSRVIYWTIHAVGIGAIAWGLLFGVSTTALVLLAVTFWARVFGVTAGYHRYFAHKSYKTSRAFQFVLAVLGASATQKGPLWWAGLHRRHHRYSDGPGDVHSPKQGFYYAHQGWIFDPRWNATPLELIPDFARYPELRWLNRHHYVPVVALAVACTLIGGFEGLAWGFCASTTLLWHATYSINSLAHLWGTRRYETTDTSRNNFLLALLTMGEGWHNNHHYYMASARQGFRWWEIDLSYYVLRGLAAVGLVWDLREPPAAVVAGRGRPSARTDEAQAA